MIAWTKNVNNFQIAKSPASGLCQFQPGVTYKSVAYKKKRVTIFTKKLHRRCLTGL